MRNNRTSRKWPWIIALSLAVIMAACGGSAPLQQSTDMAAEPTAAWVKAFNAGDPAALAALYAEDARSLPPGGPPVAGRSQIESVLARGPRRRGRDDDAHPRGCRGAG